MISRIIFTGDLFRSANGSADQIGNVEWLKVRIGKLFADLTGLPLEIRLPLVGQTVADAYAIQGGPRAPSLDNWAWVFWDKASVNLVGRIASECAGALVVTIEMPPVLEDALNRSGIPWIDVGISPLRFMPDWAFHIKTSTHFNIDTVVRNHILTPQEIEKYVEHVRSWYGAAPITEPTVVFFAQTLRDRTLIYQRRFIGKEDILIRLDSLRNGRPLLIKPHPWQAESEVVDALVKAGGTITDCNTYALLASSQVEIVTLSSSVGREAHAFGCKATIISPTVQDWAFSGVDVLHHALSPHFWGTLFASAGIPVGVAEEADWHPNQLRGSIPQQGLDLAVWEPDDSFHKRSLAAKFRHRDDFELSLAESPKISFVIPLFNHLAETRAMLASLQASLPDGLDYEIILADDASTDGTAAWLKTLRDPRIKVLLCETNRGYAANNNAGVRLTKGEILGLLNNDLLFKPGWLEPMMAALLSPDLKAGLVGNLQYRVADGALDHAGVELNPIGQFRHIRTLPGKPLVKSLAVTGACMFLRKADFETVGGFDEAFVNGCEDYDLCFKLRATEKAIYLASESRIRHHVSLSRTTNTLQDLRNSRHLFARWRPEIKRELSDVWRGLLAAGPAAYAEKLSGVLAADFLSTPHAAARVIAEAILRREASFWASKLDDAGSHVAGKMQSHGLRFSPEHGAHLLENSAEFVIEGLQYARNFYVCGRRIDDLSQPVTLTIRVNGLQTIKIPLEAERNVNVGLTDPLLLPGIANTFHVESGRALLLTHLVIDDRVVDL